MLIPSFGSCPAAGQRRHMPFLCPSLPGTATSKPATSSPAIPGLGHSPRAGLLGTVLVGTVLLCAPLSRLTAEDCNGNGVEDSTELASGVASDCNGNGVPDACESVPLIFGITERNPVLTQAPRVVSAADLNADGRADLIVGNNDASNNSGVTVVLSLGDGLFADEVVYDGGRRLSAVGVEDLDADGDLDVTTVNSGLLRVHKNTGDGTLEEPVEFTVPTSTRSIAIVDITGDGLPDLVTGNPSKHSVSWLANLGAATFSTATTLDVGLRPVSVVPGDYDGDGDFDVAVANRDSETILMLDNEAGSLRSGATFPTGPLPTVVAGADFDADGWPDLVIGRRDGFSVLYNDAGSFVESNDFVLATGVFVVEDIDADGFVDILVGSFDRTSVSLFRGGGAGGSVRSFLAPQRVSADHVELGVGDLDADGQLDLIAPAIEPNRVAVLYRDALDSLRLEGTRYPALGRPHGLAVEDLNGDGFADVVTSNGDDTTYTTFFNRGDGTLEPALSTSIPGNHLGSCTANDLDLDGDIDLIFWGPTASVIVLLNQGGAVWSEPIFYTPGTGGGRFVTVADLDGDGFSEVLAPDLGGNTISVYFNDGRGGLTGPLPLTVGSSPWEVKVDDLDGDGDHDIVAANNGSSDLSILLNLGGRSFAPARSFPLARRPIGVAVADFDQDGRKDLGVSGGGTAIDFHLNLGGGEFGPPAVFSLERAPFSIDAFDIDLDGFQDVVTSNEGSASVSVLRGRGDGTFAPVLHFAVGSGPRLALGKDMDLDGDIDLVTANRESSDVSVFVNLLGAPAADVDALETICTELDFQTVSVPTQSMFSDRVTKYIVPARSDAALLPPLFQNLTRFALHQEFLVSVFPERFGDLTAEGYRDLAERRATRDYYGGAIRRLDLDGMPAYGFSVVVADDAPAEVLSVEETAGVYESLRTAFTLEPLVYFPDTAAAREVAATWQDPGFPVVLEDPGEEPPDPPEPPPTPTFRFALPEELSLCGVFGDASLTRGPLEEFERKATLRFLGGAVELPTDSESFAAELFDELVFGPDAEILEPSAAGEFRMLRVPLGADLFLFRFTYSQEFLVADGRVLDVELVTPLQFRTSGGVPESETITLGEADFTVRPGSELFQASIDGTPAIRFGSCTNRLLPEGRVSARLEDGTELELRQRHRATDSVLDTAAASLTRAEIRVPESDTRVVTNYFDLVYSAFRHNRAVTYWVVLNPPLQVPGLEAPIHAIELDAPEDAAQFLRDASARYLGPSFEPVKEIAVVTFTAIPGEEPVVRLFQRGDVDSDGVRDVTDVIGLLEYLFQRGTAPGCLKAADGNDDGRLNLLDPLFLVGQIFGARASLPDPFPGCGEDPTEDSLSCSVPAVCEEP